MININSYFLYVNGDFETHEDVEKFSTLLQNIDVVDEIKYVIEDIDNIIVIFESMSSRETLIENFGTEISPENCRYYFLFKLSGLVMSLLPIEIKDKIFKPGATIEFEDFNQKKDLQQTEKIYDVDTILDKIEEHGISSLTPEEKSFLDNLDS